MKSKIQFKAPAAILMILLIPLALATAQQPVPQPGVRAINNATGLPASAVMPAIDPNTGLPLAPPAPKIDPTTGLPLPTPEPQWIDPNWGDPATVLPDVEYNGLPASEVAKDLRERFKGDFDILPMPQAFNQDWGSTLIVNLQLKNVKASEVFNAMNMVFENDRTPVRWELKMNGNRPTVQLRVLPEAAPQPTTQPTPVKTQRMVYFVGNLIGDEKSGGMTMEQIVKTVTDMWPADLGKPSEVIQFHKEAQLLVANGTQEQLDFINNTLAALQQRAAWQRSNGKSYSADKK